MSVHSFRSPIEELPSLEAVIREHVIAVLTACHGNRTVAARALDIDRKTIYRMLLRWQADGLMPATAIDPR